MLCRVPAPRAHAHAHARAHARAHAHAHARLAVAEGRRGVVVVLVPRAAVLLAQHGHVFDQGAQPQLVDGGHAHAGHDVPQVGGRVVVLVAVVRVGGGEVQREQRDAGDLAADEGLDEAGLVHHHQPAHHVRGRPVRHVLGQPLPRRRAVEVAALGLRRLALVLEAAAPRAGAARAQPAQREPAGAAAHRAVARVAPRTAAAVRSHRALHPHAPAAQHAATLQERGRGAEGVRKSTGQATDGRRLR